MTNNPLSQIEKMREDLLIKSREQSLRTIRPFALEHITTLHAVRYFNDSAATSIDKSCDSIMAFDEPVVWLIDANAVYEDFQPFLELLQKQVKVLVAVGDRADELHKLLNAHLKFYVSARNWEEALEMALAVTKEGDNVLLSPSVPAAEPFENFRERGEYLTSLINIKCAPKN